MIAPVGTKVSTPDGSGFVCYGHYENGKPHTVVYFEECGSVVMYADDDPNLQVMEGEDGLS